MWQARMRRPDPGGRYTVLLRLIQWVDNIHGDAVYMDSDC